jgi:hypothetical protein
MARMVSSKTNRTMKLIQSKIKNTNRTSTPPLSKFQKMVGKLRNLMRVYQVAHRFQEKMQGRITRKIPRKVINTEKLTQTENNVGRDSLAKELTHDQVSKNFYTLGSLSNILS